MLNSSSHQLDILYAWKKCIFFCRTPFFSYTVNHKFWLGMRTTRKKSSIRSSGFLFISLYFLLSFSSCMFFLGEWSHGWSIERIIAVPSHLVSTLLDKCDSTSCSILLLKNLTECCVLKSAWFAAKVAIGRRICTRKKWSSIDENGSYSSITYIYDSGIPTTTTIASNFEAHLSLYVGVSHHQVELFWGDYSGSCKVHPSHTKPNQTKPNQA